MRAEVANDAAPGSSRSRHTARRFRHLAICIALTALAFQQAPGLGRPRHQDRPDVNPGRVAAPLAAPLGPHRHVRSAAEPGVRLPVADGAVLRARIGARPRAVGGPAAVVGADLLCRLPGRRTARGQAAASARPPDADDRRCRLRAVTRILTQLGCVLGGVLAQRHRALGAHPARWASPSGTRSGGPSPVGPRRRLRRWGQRHGRDFAVVPLALLWLATLRPCAAASSPSPPGVARWRWPPRGGWFRCSSSGGTARPSWTTSRPPRNTTSVTDAVDARSAAPPTGSPTWPPRSGRPSGRRTTRQRGATGRRHPGGRRPRCPRAVPTRDAAPPVPHHRSGAGRRARRSRARR